MVSRKTLAKSMIALGTALIVLALVLSLTGNLSATIFWVQIGVGSVFLVVGVVVLIVEVLTAVWSKMQTSLVDGLQAG